MRRPITFVGLAVLTGAVLAATVFRSDIAQATGLAQAVTVDNTSANPVPVREQNRDANGNIKVHEEGTPTIQLKKASRVEFHLGLIPVGGIATHDFAPIAASQIIATFRGGELIFILENGDDRLIELHSAALEGQNTHVIPLVEPVEMDRFFVFCRNGSSDLCEYRLTLIGR